MHTFLSLDVVARVLDFPKGRVPCRLRTGGELGKSMWGSRREVGEGEEVGIFIGIIYKIIRKLKKKNRKRSGKGQYLVFHGRKEYRQGGERDTECVYVRGGEGDEK